MIHLLTKESPGPNGFSEFHWAFNEGLGTMLHKIKMEDHNQTHFMKPAVPWCHGRTRTGKDRKLWGSEKRFSRKRDWPPRLRTWILSPEPTRLKARTDFLKLPTDLYVCASMTCTCMCTHKCMVHTHTHTHISKDKQKLYANFFKKQILPENVKK